MLGSVRAADQLRQAKILRTLQCFSVLRGSIDDRQLAMTMNKKLQHLNTKYLAGSANSGSLHGESHTTL